MWSYIIPTFIIDIQLKSNHWVTVLLIGREQCKWLHHQTEKITLYKITLYKRANWNKIKDEMIDLATEFQAMDKSDKSLDDLWTMFAMRSDTYTNDWGQKSHEN